MINTTEKKNINFCAFDDPNIWGKKWFKSRLLKSLTNQGFEEKTIKAFSFFLSNSRIKTYKEYCIEIERHISNSPKNEANQLNSIHKYIKKNKNYNETIYRPNTIGDHQVRYWPNNPKVLQDKWEAYVDIYEANFNLKQNRFINKKTVLASAGSCFAKNISLQLQHWNYNYKIEMKAPEYANNSLDLAPDPARCGNIYNSSSMKYMLARAFGEWDPEKVILWQYPKVFEAFRSYSDSVTADQYFNYEWKEYNKALNRTMKNCEVFILTLGNTEVWTFSDTGEPLSLTPKKNCDLSLMKLKNQTVEDVLADLDDFYKIFKKHNPKVKIIATVSPVPLNATFNKDKHVVVANSLSKSTIRVALEYFCNKHKEDVFYFPALEIITYGCKTPWKPDMRHVSNQSIAKVMRAFQWAFMEDQSKMPIIWEETDLQFNSKRNYVLRYFRKFLVHPLKKVLGIQGKPFRALLN